MAAGDWKEMLNAAQRGNLELVRYHIRMGEDPNYQHPEFLTTPLVEATTYRHAEVVEYLLANGADPNIKSELLGKTALEMAKQNRHEAVVQLLTKS